MVRLRSEAIERYRVDYVTGFSTSGFSYFLTNQRDKFELTNAGLLPTVSGQLTSRIIQASIEYCLLITAIGLHTRDEQKVSLYLRQIMTSLFGKVMGKKLEPYFFGSLCFVYIHNCVKYPSPWRGEREKFSPGPAPIRLGRRRRSKILSTPKCAILKSRNSEVLSIDGHAKMLSLGPAVALDVPASINLFLQYFY